MTREEAESELMQIYMSLSEEKKQALDVLMAQADGEYISKEAVIDIIEDVCPIYENDYRYILREKINELPSVDIPPEHDGCKDCKHELKSDGEYPCSYCKQNYKDMWEREKPTDTITMTREEFSEKLMEHYRQGRADEKAYQNGEIMQSFNPD